MFVVIAFLIEITASEIRNCIATSSQTINGVIYEKCSSCNQGYVVDSQKHCDKCDEDKGYIQDTSQIEFTCTKYQCSENKNHCLTCANEDSCSNCEDGYTLTGPENYKNCLKCAHGYEQSSSSEFECIKITCSNGLRHCIYCNSDGVSCDTCQDGYKASSNDIKICDSCAEDYIKKGNGNDFECKPVCNIDKCTECYSPNVCVECENGFMVQDNKCVVDCHDNIANCDECSTIDDTHFKCWKCFSGYKLYDEAECIPMPFQCEEGDPKSKTCTKCKTGYYLKDETCHPCPEDKHCTHCELVAGSSEIKCIGSSCKTGYYLKDGECLQCPNIPNCKSCYLADESEEPTCISCEQGYGLDSNNECQKCGDHQLICGEYIYCDEGYYEFNNGCEKCPEIDNCASCYIDEEISATDPVCLTCAEGFGHSEDFTSCIPCIYEHCTSCYGGTCNSCDDGYYTEGQDCIQCPSDINCDTCRYDSQTKRPVCRKCPDGYYLSSEEICLPCSENCVQCYPTKDDTICLKCNEFSDPDNNKCIAKSCEVEGMSGCSECRTDGANIKECISCENNDYQVAEDKLSCVPKPCDPSSIPYCEECKIENSKEVCTKCSGSYHLLEGECINPHDLPHYLCICNDDSSCNACKSDIIISENVITQSELIEDPKQNYVIRIFSDIVIDLSIFYTDHNVEINTGNVLTLKSFNEIDEFDTRNIKINQYLSFNSLNNVILIPYLFETRITLPTQEEGIPFTIQLPENWERTLSLRILNTEKVNTPKITIKGKGKVNAFDYPFDCIIADKTVKVIKGAILICSSQNGNNLCDSDLIESYNYKVVEHLESVTKKLDENTIIAFYLNTFTSEYIDVDINFFNGQELLLFNDIHSKLLDEPSKLRILSTEVLHAYNDNMKFEGTTGSTVIEYINIDTSNFVVGFDDELKVVHDEVLSYLPPTITLQAQKADSTIILDKSVELIPSLFRIDSAQENAKVKVYIENSNTDGYDSCIDFDESMEVSYEQGTPGNSKPIYKPTEPITDKSKGLPAGAIAGIVVGVVVVVGAVVGVVVFLILRKKKNNNSSEVEGDEGQNSNI